ncbi:MAG: isopentenyl-diphosphate Delta-isomerase [Pseudobacter sp.]|uniref:isopentenyl-diphosphate Delta-isomerase n=1 Tax=Pseudobacter sp. TaxID=2045420 RepID=UPI003F7EFA84
MNKTQEVILVNEKDEPIGTMEKIEAHRKALLHRAFSVFIFNSKGEMLLQQRALNKYHSAGLWTNACCSHPIPGEATTDAAHRRLQEELGFNTSLDKIFEFTYQTAFDNGLIEHEFDHVFAGVYEQRITPNPEEVHEVCYKSLDDIQQSLQTHPQKYTSWFHIAFPKVKEWAVEQGLVQPTI